MLRSVLSGALGATAAYYFDPVMGRGRRTRLRDQAAARVRRAGRFMGKKARYQVGKAKGVLHRVTDFGRRGDLDNETMIQKIRSEALGPAGLSGSDIDIEVDLGTGEVILHGNVGDHAVWEDVTRRITALEGVRSVRQASNSSVF